MRGQRNLAERKPPEAATSTNGAGPNPTNRDLFPGGEIDTKESGILVSEENTDSTPDWELAHAIHLIGEPPDTP